MGSGERSLRRLVNKWFGMSGVTVRVQAFGRTPVSGSRYVLICAVGQPEHLRIVFFRHDDGSWNVFPPRSSLPTMCV